MFDVLIALFSVGAVYEWLRLIKPTHNFFLGPSGFFYIGMTLLILIGLRRESPVGWHELVYLFAVVWGTDTAAYIFGRLIGGPKLVPSISPNKTWAGSIGGLIGGIIAGEIANFYLLHHSIMATFVLAALFAIATQLGDLLESALKRRFQVKDSGWFIPGHGGILDRIDGLLLAAPVFALFHFWLGY